MKKRLGALLCALVMCLALLSPASALEEVCFTSLNNKLLPLPPTPCPSGPERPLRAASLFDGSATNASYGVTLGGQPHSEPEQRHHHPLQPQRHPGL